MSFPTDSSVDRRIKISTIQPISQVTKRAPGNSRLVTPTIPKGTQPLPANTMPVSSARTQLQNVGNISQAVAVEDSELAAFHAVRFILRKHKLLNEEDIRYAANFISSYYAHTNTPSPQVQSPSEILTEDQLSLFLVYADQTGISKFALIFNEELDTAIKTRNGAGLKSLLLGGEEMFVELYDNPFLSAEDRDFISRLIARELFATKLALSMLRRKLLNFEAIDDTCASETFSLQAQNVNRQVRVTALAAKCYDQVCIQDARILEDDQARANMSKYEKPPESVYTVDRPDDEESPQVYCFDTLELIDAVTDEEPINPRTGRPFSIYSLQMINSRFNKEINMYRRYRQLKEESQ